MPEKPDEQLIEEFKQGDENAMQVLFLKYNGRILNFALRIVGNRADAEDVTSEVFLAVLHQKYIWQPSAKFATWLFTIARNACLTRIRQKRNSLSLWFLSSKNEEDFFDIPDTRENSRETLVKREEAQTVRRAVAKLPVEQREAIVLREYHGFSYAEIAQVLGCSLEKVKILIFRAREQLKTELASSFQGGPSQ